MYKVITKHVGYVVTADACLFKENDEYIFLNAYGEIMQFNKQTKKYFGLNDFISNAITYEKVENL